MNFKERMICAHHSSAHVIDLINNKDVKNELTYQSFVDFVGPGNLTQRDGWRLEKRVPYEATLGSKKRPRDTAKFSYGVTQTYIGSFEKREISTYDIAKETSLVILVVPGCLDL
jgi:hypothetical protein